MNLSIYNQIYSGGLNMVSPAMDVGNSALSAVNSADSALAPLESLGVIDGNVLQSARASLLTANGSLNGAVSNIAAKANDSLRLSSLGQQVNKLDALSNAVPSSCFNTEALFGAVMGACDEAFNAVGNVASGISQKVTDYLNGVISATELEAFLGGVGDLLQSGLDSIQAQLAKEAALLEELYKKMESCSLAQSIEALWNNPCTQAILDTTLPPDIKAHL